MPRHTARFPGHALLLHALALAVSGISPVYSVRDVPGLDPSRGRTPTPLAARGIVHGTIV